MGWTGNAFILVGSWMVGNKNKYGFLTMAIGEILWVIYAIQIEISVISCIFCCLQLYNYFKWNNIKS